MIKTILFLDDDEKLCELLRPVLERDGYRAIQVHNEQDALAAIEREKPESVVIRGKLIQGRLQQLLAAVLFGSRNKLLSAGTADSSAANASTQLWNNAFLQDEIVDAQASEHDMSLLDSFEEVPAIAGLTLKRSRDFHNMFLALKMKYARTLPRRLSELAAALEAFKGQANNEELLDGAFNSVRRVAGSAGSYGYSAIAEALGQIEELLLNAKENGVQKLKKKEWSNINTQLKAAAKEAERLAAEAVEQAAIVVEKEPLAPRQPLANAAARILLVDEDEPFLCAVEELGRQCLVEVVKAASRSQALARACLLPLDAALISVDEAPEESFRLARDLRGVPGYENLPIAFISAAPEEQDVAEATHAGASLYIDKPLEITSLESAVQHLVTIRQGGRSRILIVDADLQFGQDIAAVLRNEGCLVHLLGDASKTLEVMQEYAPDLLLLDVLGPGSEAFDVCRSLRVAPRWQDLPIIFLTAQTSAEARLQAFRCGADDYLPKPIIHEELLARVRIRLEKARLLQERSDKDTITGLLLRRAFMEQLNAVHAETQRIKGQFSLCLMDIDHFKRINDTYGHLAGDRVLTGLGQLLQRRFRVDDIRGRWGGEELIVAFKRENKSTIHAAVNRVLEEFRLMTFEGDGGEKFKVSFSGGLASYPEDGSTPAELLGAADRRLCEAKKAGRCRVESAD